jgi:hypothetical protein
VGETDGRGGAYLMYAQHCMFRYTLRWPLTKVRQEEGGRPSLCSYSPAKGGCPKTGTMVVGGFHYCENHAPAVEIERRPAVVCANPKDAVGSSKAPMSCVSAAVLGELGLAMLEGSLKYGRHNYRTAPIRASVYFDAVSRHMRSWWDEGEDLDPDSKLSHIAKAIATLVVLRDSMITGKWDDDRPPPVPAGFFAGLDTSAAELVARYPAPKDPVRAKR